MVEERFISEGPGSTTAVTVYDTPARRSGISWPAIFAGALAALMVMLILNMLAVGIGLTSFNLVDDTTPVARSAGGVTWAIVIIELIAVAFGGWLAGMLASRRAGSGFLHGVLSWALVTIATLWLLGSAAGSVISGVGSAISSSLSLATQGITALAPAASAAVEQATSNLNLNTTDLRNTLMELLTGAPAETTPATTPAAPAGAAQPSTAASSTFARAQTRTLLNNLFTSGEPPFSDTNKATMISLLVQDADLTEEQATELVDGWEQDYVQAQAAIQQAKDEVTVAADDARRVLSRVALYGALGLIVGALLAGWLGAMGARRGSDMNLRT